MNYLVIIELILILILIKYIFSLRKYLNELKEISNKILNNNYNINLKFSKNASYTEIGKAIELLTAQMKIKDSKSSLDTSNIQAILSTVPEGLIAIDLEEQIIFANQKAKDLIGIPNIGEGERLFAKIYDQEVSQKIQDLIYGKKSEAKEKIYKKHLQLRASKIVQGKENIPMGHLISITDITELVQTEKIRQDFVSNVTHELKTPITSISGFAETLIENQDLPGETQYKFLKIIDSESKRLNELIDDILTFSFIEENQEIKFERVNVVKIIENIVYNIKNQAQHKNIDIKLNSERNNIFIQSNKNYLIRIFINLIDNSVKYSPANSKVELNIFTKNEFLFVEIIDNGRGISEEDIERVFERFFRADRSRTRSESGTGLGLAIVKHLVKSLNGKIILDSKLGEGSKFTVILPLEN